MKTVVLVATLLLGPLAHGQDGQFMVQKDTITKMSDVSKEELVRMLSPDQQAYKELRAAYRLKTMATIGISTSLLLLGISATRSLSGNEFDRSLPRVGAVLILITIPIHSKYKERSRRVVRRYNERLRLPDEVP